MRPTHLEIGPIRRIVEAVCIAAAATLLLRHMITLAMAPGAWGLGTLAMLLLGAVTADFVSGLVHWTADTWGSETMPILGRRFVHPFRVHHVNPRDFLRRDFPDTNGDVCAIALPVLVAGLYLPVDVGWGVATLGWLAGFAVAGLPTNQVHQWSHQSRPPRVVRWLQDHGVILGRGAHALHHRAPFAMNYCIATGWCNGALNRIQFFRRLEMWVHWLTGLVPRCDDQRFAQLHEGAVNEFPRSHG